MDQRQRFRWRPTISQALWASGILALLTVLVLVGYRYGISLWDWVKVLIVPAVIAGGGVWFNRQQQEHGLEIENQRGQDGALEAYLGQMGQLLLDKDTPLLLSKEGDMVRTVARARTLTVLSRLDGSRKGSVMRFLHESQLLNKGSSRSGAVISLEDADLRAAELSGARLLLDDLRKANLQEANLSGATLFAADLSKSNLEGANLSGADLLYTVMNDANLRNAELTGTILVEDLPVATFESMLKGAIMPEGQEFKDWLKDKEGRSEDRENSAPS